MPDWESKLWKDSDLWNIWKVIGVAWVEESRVKSRWKWGRRGRQLPGPDMKGPEQQVKACGLILSRSWLIFVNRLWKKKLEQGERPGVGNFIYKQPKSSANLRTQSKLKTNCSVAERFQWWWLESKMIAEMCFGDLESRPCYLWLCFPWCMRRISMNTNGAILSACRRKGGLQIPIHADPPTKKHFGAPAYYKGNAQLLQWGGKVLRLLSCL